MDSHWFYSFLNTISIHNVLLSSSTQNAIRSLTNSVHGDVGTLALKIGNGSGVEHVKKEKIEIEIS